MISFVLWRMTQWSDSDSGMLSSDHQIRSNYSRRKKKQTGEADSYVCFYRI